jgi:hypothetical protein
LLERLKGLMVVCRNEFFDGRSWRKNELEVKKEF